MAPISIRLSASMLRACLAVAGILLTAGCNTAPDTDEEQPESGVLRAPVNVPAAPEGMVAITGDRFYMFVLADWNTASRKFDESSLQKGNSVRLLEGDWQAANIGPAEVGGSLNIILFPTRQMTSEQQATEMVETWKRMPHTKVTHVESSPIVLADGTPARLLVMEARTEHKKLSDLMELEGGHYLFVQLFASVEPASYWFVDYMLSSNDEHELVHHDSALGKSLVASVKSLTIVPGAQEAPAAPR